MASVYKWRITNTKYAFITDKTGGDPFITNSAVTEEEKYSAAARGLTETAYAIKFEAMRALIAADDEGKNLVLQNYKYYYDFDNESNCSVVNYGTQGVGISSIAQSKSGNVNTITFNLTDGSHYDIYINDGSGGEAGPRGTTGAVGATGASGRPGAPAVLDRQTVINIVSGLSLATTIKSEISSEFNGRFDAIESSATTLEAAVRTLNTDLSSTRTNLSTVGSTASNANLNTTLLTNRYSGLSATTDAAISLINDYGNLIPALQSAVTQNFEINRWQDIQISGLTTSFSGLATTFAIFQGSIPNFSGITENLNNSIKGVNSGYTRLFGDVLALSNTVSGMTNDIVKLNSGVTINMGNISDLKNADSALTESIGNLTTSAESLYTMIINVSGNTVTPATVTQTITEIVDPRFATQNNKIVEVNTKYNNLLMKYDEVYEKTFKYLNPYVDDHTSKIKTLIEFMNSISGVTNDISSLKTRVTTLEGKINS